VLWGDALAGVSATLVLALVALLWVARRWKSLRRWCVVIRMMREALPPPLPSLTLAGRSGPVRIAFDTFGIPSITAQSRPDAAFGLGYACARDRLFQMDYLRRKASGSLSEVLGPVTLAEDIEKRRLGFVALASRALEGLPPEQREVLEAFASGVNASVEAHGPLAFEFGLLGYRPEAWAASDSLLIFLELFHTLCGDQGTAHMVAVMRRTLPPEVVEFLTPELDEYANPLVGRAGSDTPADRALPKEQLLEVLRRAKGRPDRRLVQIGRAAAGSNGWVVGPAKTQRGSPLLANDIHLGFTVPNLWYRCSLRYENVSVSGVIIAGIPVIVCGSNGKVAWGVTNASVTCLSLEPLEVRGTVPGEYRAPAGWVPFGLRQEVIRVRWGEPQCLVVQETVWGPVAATPVLGRPAAISWTGLDPSAVDLGLMNLERVQTVQGGIEVATRSGGPPLNIMLADADGHIGWTLSGRLPVAAQRRPVGEPESHPPWASCPAYVSPDEHPRVVDPASGVLVTANNCAVGPDGPHRLSGNYCSGYRAWRIAECLAPLTDTTEEHLFTLQLDTRAGVYDFYRDLALSVISPEVVARGTQFLAVQHVLRQWDGKAEVDSHGLWLLIAFRELLAVSVLGALLQSCQDQDPHFAYRWFNYEPPLRALLQVQPLDLLPEPDRYGDWPAFLRDKLIESLELVLTSFKAHAPEHLRWGMLNRAVLPHPLSPAVPWLSGLLDLPPDPIPGCADCVCVGTSSHGASFRMVISPGDLKRGIAQMIGGQSGNPLSPHFADQHMAWAKGNPQPYLPR
jgi:penicillin amidase